MLSCRCHMIVTLWLPGCHFSVTWLSCEHLATCLCRSKEGQKLDASRFPGPEALSQPGKKHGDTQVVRNNNQLEVYQVGAACGRVRCLSHSAPL